MANKDSDLVIGFITNYKEYNKIKPWVESLIDSGFTGTKMLVTYNIDEEIIKIVQDKDFFVIPLSNQEKFNIVNVRFLHIWQFLKNVAEKPRYVISTDVADVVFQSNPSDWLEQHIGNKKLCASAESLRYKDESWGINNMTKSFGPLAANYMSEMPIYNAGVTAGTYEEYIDLCYNVYLLCNGAPQYIEGGGGPDQAALNLLLSLKPYKDITLYTNHDDGWACQCGTTVDPNKINGFRPNLLSPEPVWKDGVMYNSKGDKYAILHQYNRVPMINDYIRKKYDIGSSDIQHNDRFVYHTN
jgi:hypothetical protein